MNNHKWQKIIENPNREKFNYCQELMSVKSLAIALNQDNKNILINSYSLEPGNVFLLKNVLSEKEVHDLYKHINLLNYYPVGKSGNAKEFKECDEVISLRASIYDHEFSNALFNKIKHFLPTYFTFDHDDYSVKVNQKNANYYVLGINPYQRVVKYKQQGKLVPHYDGHHFFDSHTQTAMTMLIYLTTNQTGQTVFLEDAQKFIPHEQRKENHKIEEKVLLSIKPKMGDILLFNQYLLHATAQLHLENKDLILTDLVIGSYQKTT